MIETRQTLADLATRLPAASEVFHRYGLDFCCGGSRTLDDACAARGLDPETVAREIAARAEEAPAPRWDRRPLGALIDHILERYHAPLRAELPRLIGMAARVEERHGGKETCPAGLAGLLSLMADEIEEHLQKEEAVLFPMIQAGQGRMLEMPVRVMRLEHDQHGANLRRLRRLAHDFVPPPEACPTWNALYLGLARLEHELMDHIHLENNVLFPRALAGENTTGDTP